MNEEMQLFWGLMALSTGLGFTAALLLRLLKGRVRLLAAIALTGTTAAALGLAWQGRLDPDRTEARTLSGLLLGLTLLWLLQVVCGERRLFRHSRLRLRWLGLAFGSVLLLIYSTLLPAVSYAAAVLAAQLLDRTSGPACREDDPPLFMASFLVWHVGGIACLLVTMGGSSAQMLLLAFGFGAALAQVLPLVQFLRSDPEQEPVMGDTADVPRMHCPVEPFTKGNSDWQEHT